MYLWKRENGFTYQQRIPVSVESQFGKSPIRVNLGPLPAAAARKRAIILSGAAMQLMDDPTMTRETLVHSLRALNAELQVLKHKNFPLGALVVRAGQEADELEAEGAESYARTLREKAQRLAAEKAGIANFRQRLESIADALSKDSIAWESERETFQSVVRTLGSLGAPVHLPQVQREQQVQPPEPQPTEYRDARTVTASTKFSVAGRVVLDARKEALDNGDKDRVRYEERLENTFSAFLNVVGDHPLSFYLPIHLQDFATVMAKVPKNRTKHPIFAGLNLKQMVEKNDKLPEKDRINSLSQTTVKEHVAQIKLIWEKATAGVTGIRDIRSFNVTMPTAATPAINREGLPPLSLNTWLADSVSSRIMKKPHKAWLPLVGLLTGMRLSEIVYLQSSDIVTIEGNEVFDLRLPLTIDGKKVDRPLKTRTSVRIVAIHPLLQECGFIDFAKKQRGRGGFIFPHYHTARDPADAAQKQMSNWMGALDIHESQRQVFHSLRHNAKSWFRINVGDGLADKQCGHSASTVGAKYGFKAMEPEEIQKIMSIPAPRGVDFSPFIEWRRRTE
ncbi:hypothetical protein [Ciceribacter selenitireducens]|uniref:Tyr recombinase domain-containing protein n=1 Tax=Ciceribacter selenitireducens ATCC BAA-1503 TaxID=1336235 RepID=A0A376AA52_9HYPH|nr:hypothetical protein [Ciceribacter selenitireducens]SSC64527.1 unnamed protein product [Ciceribacter selenitireducens ATCC BAA-1503]